MNDKYRPQFAGEDRSAFEQFLFGMYGERRVLVDVQEQSDGPQGYSGSQICYFDLASENPQGAIYSDSVVTKSASLLERRVPHQLSSQGYAVPPMVMPDITSDES